MVLSYWVPITTSKQDCIPVGCVPPACWPYLPEYRGGVPGPGGCTWSRGVSALGVYLVLGGWCLLPGVYLVWGVYLVLGVYLIRGCTWSVGGVPVPGEWCTWSRGVYLVWGGLLQVQGVSGTPPLWTEWQTGAKILPCPKLRLRAVKIQRKIYHWKRVLVICRMFIANVDLVFKKEKLSVVSICPSVHRG